MRIENPCVGGSIPPQATKIYLAKKPTHAVGFFVSLIISNFFGSSRLKPQC
jgi:hypothetical protein